MPLQNRVTPLGELEVSAARGAWMGNRGILHDKDQKILAPWRHKAWVTCRLRFKGRHREVFSPHHYSELFFLDEATAFSAGHRPCAECRRERYEEFKTAWSLTNLGETPKHLSVRQIDARLHQERAIRGGGKVVYEERLDALPSGTFVLIDGAPHLLWERRLYLWTHDGYRSPRGLGNGSRKISVLTPASVVAAFRRGFRPQAHESASA